MKQTKHDKRFPRYYKGHDLDVLFEKVRGRQPLTEEEYLLYQEARSLYSKSRQQPSYGYQPHTMSLRTNFVLPWHR